MQDFRQASIFCLFTLATADVIIYSQKTHKQIEKKFGDLPSTFGASIPVGGIKAFLVYSNPANACSTIAPPPNITNSTERWAVLIQRWDCDYATKVRNAQNASYDVAIVHNVNSTEIVRMTAVDPSGISIPSVFISGPSGVLLKDDYQYSKGYYIILDDVTPFGINIYLLLSCAIVAGICSAAMIGFMIYRCITCRTAPRDGLLNSSQQKIPTTLFRRGDPYETCVICLEDFVIGEKLRILPCSHAYHCSCIDPWFTRSRRVCPMCQRKVSTGRDSDIGNEEDDNTPLLRSNQPRGGQGGGTFNTVNENQSLIASLRRLFIPSSLANDNPVNRTSALPSTSRFHDQAHEYSRDHTHEHARRHNSEYASNPNHEDARRHNHEYASNRNREHARRHNSEHASNRTREQARRLNRYHARDHVPHMGSDLPANTSSNMPVTIHTNTRADRATNFGANVTSNMLANMYSNMRATIPAITHAMITENMRVYLREDLPANTRADITKKLCSNMIVNKRDIRRAHNSKHRFENAPTQARNYASNHTREHGRGHLLEHTVNMRANVPATIPVNTSADITALMRSNLSVTMRANMPAIIPSNTSVEITAHMGPNMTVSMCANMPATIPSIRVQTSVRNDRDHIRTHRVKHERDRTRE